MQTKSLLAISVSAGALICALPAHGQPVANTTEAELIDSHALCDRGDRQACIRFGFILGENRAYWSEWRQLHPEWWAWETAGGAQVGTQVGTQVADITIAPPELPVYEQPPLPGPGYIWTPGYWAYGAEGYYWVPGTWVLPPAVGVLWTPGYWGWRNGLYVWNAGYWGPHVGFYGGINYGFGYGGTGYEGGRWNNGVFTYNTTVTNFGAVRVTHVYSETVVVRTDVRVSFNGGSGGVQAKPTPQEAAFAHERHTPPTAEQSHQQQVASSDKSLLASENHGRPAIAATAKPGEFSGSGVVAAREAPRGGAPAGVPPTGAKTMEAAPSALKPLQTNPSEARKPETVPSEAKRSEPNSNEVRKPISGPSEAIRSEPKPAEAIKPELNSGGIKPPEKKPMENERATLNGGAPPKPLNAESKPLGGAAPLKPLPPKPPQPQMATAPKPHPVVAPRPPAKPAAPQKDKKNPA